MPMPTEDSQSEQYVPDNPPRGYISQIEPVLTLTNVQISPKFARAFWHATLWEEISKHTENVIGKPGKKPWFLP